MKKTSNKAGSHSLKWDFSTDTNPQIPLVFFVFGLILILTYLFKTHHPDWLTQNIVDDFPGYVWISKSPEIDQGLYLLKADKGNGGLPVEKITAIQINGSGQREQIPLPAKVANVFLMPIDINSADQELLRTLPGIGSALAERIIAKRNATDGFKSPGELLQINGIGPKKLARIRQHILIN